MAINKDVLREKFKTLSTRYGGSLLEEKVLLDQDDVVVFFGLGGLGSRAVNAIKASTNERLKNPDKRFFRVVDTCKDEMELVCEANKEDLENLSEESNKPHGCIKVDEKLPLYGNTFKIKTLGPQFDSWLNREVFNEVTVDNKGAQGRRQIGRVMLMAHGNYNTVYNNICEVLQTAKNKAVNSKLKVYIIAGISGGTGSGTIIDFSYMVRKAMESFDEKDKDVEAIIFTPDVQTNDENMTDEKRQALKINFYAAIKEVDFFYNVKARSSAYVCPVGGDCSAYHEDIFDRITLISRNPSGVEIMKNSDEVVKKLGDAIALELSGIKSVGDGGNIQSYAAFSSNVNDEFANWWQGNIDNQGHMLPDWVVPRYSSLGYASFYVPRDELMAYCANLLMERLVEKWEQRVITKEEVDNLLNSCNLLSNRTFASSLFRIGDCESSFEVSKRELPVDGWGPAKVKNCQSYLDIMHDTAIAESNVARINMILTKATNRMNDNYINRIIQTIDKAFSDTDRGPVFAINLLSAGLADPNAVFSYHPIGVLTHLKKMIDDFETDVSEWDNDLKLIKSRLDKKALEYDGKTSIDPSLLNDYTSEVRKYGEDLLKVKILAKAKDLLIEIYNKINDKNNKVFEIFTTTFEFLLSVLKKDSQYVTDSGRHREGQVTVFHFDIADFTERDPKSEKFKEFFSQAVNSKNIDAASKEFVENIFGKLKELLDPSEVDNKHVGEVTEDDVIAVIRNYFNNNFFDWTSEVIEKFCVIAYSDVQISPSELDKAWDNEALKRVAADLVAGEIQRKLDSESRVLLSSTDPGRSVEDYCARPSFLAIKATPSINSNFNSIGYLSTNWPEYIKHKRIFGFPLAFLGELSECKRLYDATQVSDGLHLDEITGNWRVNFPEPFSYNIAKFLNRYNNNGSDITEHDKQHMEKILEKALTAKSLGLLIEEVNAGGTAKQTDLTYEYQKQQGSYFKLTFDLLRPIDFASVKEEMYQKMKTAYIEAVENEEEVSMIKVLVKAGYDLAKPVSIRWNFARPEYNIMKNRTEFGDDLVFGNFITLLRSNYEWEEKLDFAVELFGKINALYQVIVKEVQATELYNSRKSDFAWAIVTDMITPVLNSAGKVNGFKLQWGKRERDSITLESAGWDSFDKYYVLYHFFKEEFLELDEEKFEVFKDILRLNRDKAVNETTTSGNADDMLLHVSNILNDDEYLANSSKAMRKKAFKEAVSYSEKQYNLPSPADNNKDIDAVINNLKVFYEYLESQISKNGNLGVKG